MAEHHSVRMSKLQIMA